MDILLPVILIGGMGLLFGALLAVASKIFAIKVDERIPMVVEALPGANCGGCGYAGCNAYAAAVVDGSAAVNCCPVGGEAVVQKLAKIMGVSAEKAVKKVARVLCNGTHEKATSKYIYDGPADCHVAAKLGGGPKSCSYGCLGLGSCVKVCDFDAINIVDGVAKIDMDKCTACGACVSECPKSVIKILPYDSRYTVYCKSEDKGKLTRQVCSVGCIGCGICVKNCPKGAITLENNLAVIDPELCINCGICMQKCPQKTICVTEEEKMPKIQVAKKAG